MWAKWGWWIPKQKNISVLVKFKEGAKQILIPPPMNKLRLLNLLHYWNCMILPCWRGSSLCASPTVWVFWFFGLFISKCYMQLLEIQRQIQRLKVKSKFLFCPRSLSSLERSTVTNLVALEKYFTYKQSHMCMFMCVSTCVFMHPNTYKT